MCGVFPFANLTNGTEWTDLPLIRNCKINGTSICSNAGNRTLSRCGTLEPCNTSDTCLVLNDTYCLERLQYALPPLEFTSTGYQFASLFADVNTAATLPVITAFHIEPSKTGAHADVSEPSNTAAHKVPNSAMQNMHGACHTWAFLTAVAIFA